VIGGSPPPTHTHTSFRCDRYARAETSHRLLANYDPSDFASAFPLDAFGGAGAASAQPLPVAALFGGGAKEAGAESAKTRKEVEDGDKLALQSYGRPYANGKPSGTYYSYPKPAPLPTL